MSAGLLVPTCARPTRLHSVTEHVDVVYHRSGTGAPLVLIHGIGSRWQMWQPVLEPTRARAGGDRVRPSRLRRLADAAARHSGGYRIAHRPDLAVPGPARLERPCTSPATRWAGGRARAGQARPGRLGHALSPAGFHNSREAVYQRGSLATTLQARGACAPARADRLEPLPGDRAAGTWSQMRRPPRAGPAARRSRRDEGARRRTRGSTTRCGRWSRSASRAASGSRSR